MQPEAPHKNRISSNYIEQQDICFSVAVQEYQEWLFCRNPTRHQSQKNILPFVGFSNQQYWRLRKRNGREKEGLAH